MYSWLKSIILPLLRIEDAEPHPPAGHVPHTMLRVERAAPGFLNYRLVEWLLYAAAWGLLIVVISVALLIKDWRLLVLVVPLVLLAVAKAATLYVTMRLDYEMRWYVITERSLLIREGVWDVRELTLTFANAQNVRVTQGPVERFFGFSTVEVETAGGGSSEGATGHRARLRGLANPREVRDVILDLLRRHRTAGLGDPDDRQSRGREPLEVRAGKSAQNPLPHTLVQDVWQEAKALREALERPRLPPSPR